MGLRKRRSHQFSNQWCWLNIKVSRGYGNETRRKTKHAILPNDWYECIPKHRADCGVAVQCGARREAENAAGCWRSSAPHSRR
jgi:hypothetical protein